MTRASERSNRFQTRALRGLASSVSLSALALGVLGLGSLIDGPSRAQTTVQTALVLKNGARIEGDLLGAGERYLMVADVNGGYHIISRDDLLSLEMIEPADIVASTASSEQSDQLEIAAAPSDEATFPRLVQLESHSAIEEQAAALNDAISSEAEAQDLLIEEIEAALSTAPAPETAEQTETESAGSGETGAVQWSAAVSDAVRVLSFASVAGRAPLESVSDATAPGETSELAPSEASSPELGAILSTAPGGATVVIPLDSPQADRSTDQLQILTAPAVADVVPPSFSAPERATNSAPSPIQPAAPTLSAPAMATPQLSLAFSEPDPAPPVDDVEPPAPEPEIETTQPAPSQPDFAANSDMRAALDVPSPSEQNSGADPATQASALSQPLVPAAPEMLTSADASGRPPLGDDAVPESDQEPVLDISSLQTDAPPSSEAGPLEENSAAAAVIEAQFGSENDGSDLTSFSPGVLDADAVNFASQAAADASIPGVDPARLSIDPSMGGLFAEHRMGVYGPPQGYEGRISCAELGASVVSPRAYAEDRLDPGALTIEIDADASAAAARLLAAAFVAAQSDAERWSGDESVLFAFEPSAPQLALPDRVIGVRSADAMSALSTGAADIAIIAGAPPTGAYESGRARLIAFDALAFIAHPDAPQDALSAGDLNGLFLGRLDDWSMIEPSTAGRALLILPPDGAPALIAALEYAGARRARPSSSRRVAGAESRADAVAVTPGAIGLTLWSLIDETTALRLGGRSSGVAPSFDTIRSGAYPLAWPIYVVLPEEPTHASAAILFEFLSGPSGQRAVFDAGLTPVAACDPSTCGLSALGLASAIERLSTPPRVNPLEIAEPAEVRGQMVASFVAPVDLGAPSDQFVQSLADFIATIEPSGSLFETPLQIVARAGPAPGTTTAAAEARALQSLSRAESAALALRCAGLPIDRVLIDPSPILDGTHATDTVQIELAPRPETQE